MGQSLKQSPVACLNEPWIALREVAYPKVRVRLEEVLQLSLVFFRADRAGRIDKRASGPQRPRAGLQDPPLKRPKPLDLVGGLAPPYVRARLERAEVRAGRIHEHSIVAFAVGWLGGIAHYDLDAARAEPRAVGPGRLGPPRIMLDRDHAALVADQRCDVSGLGAGCRAQVEDALARAWIEHSRNQHRGTGLWHQQPALEGHRGVHVPGASEHDRLRREPVGPGLD